MVLAAVVVLAILAQTAYVLTSYQLKRDREEELLFRGTAYVQAIQNYYLGSPPGAPQSFPRNLTDLLADPRFLQHKRYLRSLYPDPMGKEWNLVKGPDGSLTGVASTSQDKPLKQDNFPAIFQNFTGSQHYSQWIFIYQPVQPAAPVAAQPVSVSGF